MIRGEKSSIWRWRQKGMDCFNLLDQNLLNLIGIKRFASKIIFRSFWPGKDYQPKYKNALFLGPTGWIKKIAGQKIFCSLFAFFTNKKNFVGPKDFCVPFIFAYSVYSNT
jgi:hypothetical protein